MATPLGIQDIKPYHDQQLNLVTRGLAQNRNRVFAINLVKTVQEKADTVFAQVAKKPEGKFDCKPGCSYCCTYRIEALPPEIFLIARVLRELPPDQLEAVTARLREHAAKAQGLRPEHHNLPCPFLADSMCSIREHRPFSCRRLHSLDVEECKKPQGTPPENEELNLKAFAAFNGTVEGYLKRQLPAYPHELGQAVLRALEEPDAEERWFRGEQVFDLLPDMDEVFAQALPILVNPPPVAPR